MKPFFKPFVYLNLIAPLFWSCATITHGVSQELEIRSAPSGAKVWADFMEIGLTPLNASLRRKENHVLRIKAAGYQMAEIAVMRVSNSLWLANVLFPGPLGWIIDALSGASHELSPDKIFVNLKKETPLTTVKDQWNGDIAAWKEDAAWQETCREGTIKAYRHYQEEYPNGIYLESSKDGIAEILQWTQTKKNNNLEAYEDYKRLFPTGVHSREAEEYLSAPLWKIAQQQQTVEAFTKYARYCPTGAYYGEALSRIDDLAWEKAVSAGARQEYQFYINQFPGGKYRLEASSLIEKDYWSETTLKHTPDAYFDYLRLYPSGDHIQEAFHGIASLGGITSINIQEQYTLSKLLKSGAPLLEDTYRILKYAGFAIAHKPDVTLNIFTDQTALGGNYQLVQSPNLSIPVPGKIVLDNRGGFYFTYASIVGEMNLVVGTANILKYSIKAQIGDPKYAPRSLSLAPFPYSKDPLDSLVEALRSSVFYSQLMELIGKMGGAIRLIPFLDVERTGFLTAGDSLMRAGDFYGHVGAAAETELARMGDAAVDALLAYFEKTDQTGRLKAGGILAKITGLDYGEDLKKWSDWRKKTKRIIDNH